MADDTIWEREPHTGVKHDIYDGYLDAWLPIILSSFGSGTYAEGYAGPGTHLGGEPGSPIRALHRLRAARAQHPHLHDKFARFVLVEKRADRVARLLEELRRELDHPMPNGEYRDATLHVLVRRGACEVRLPQALTDTGAWEYGPILAVLDSFGGGSTQRLLRQFADHRGGEVLVTVDPQHFVRNLDPDRADAVFGSAAWRDVDDLAPDKKRAHIAARLIDAIRDAGFQHVISFGLQTVRGGELLLQFGTNHPRGLEKYKDSLWRADPIRGAQFRDPNDPDQMLFDFTPTAELGPLRRLLLAYLDTKPGRCATFEQLRGFT
ncbi:MAG: three-Cys-motif partner protein TcmP, partial [Pseudonocardia sp.]